MSDLLAYWSNPDDSDNQPEVYSGRLQRSDYLLSLAKMFIPREWSVFEVGCNCGRNLAWMLDAGWSSLGGIDISARAIDHGMKIYPDLYQAADIRVMSLDDWLRTGESLDCVFTMAVLEHIEDTDRVKAIANTARRCIVTIEDERSQTWKHFPRNYQGIFEEAGWRMIFSEEITGNDLDGMTARVFAHV